MIGRLAPGQRNKEIQVIWEAFLDCSHLRQSGIEYGSVFSYVYYRLFFYYPYCASSFSVSTMDGEANEQTLLCGGSRAQ